MTVASPTFTRWVRLAYACASLTLALGLSSCGGGASNSGLSSQVAVSSIAAAITPVGAADLPVVVELRKVSETRVGRTTYDYEFRVAMRNGQYSVRNVSARIASVGAGTSVVDGLVSVIETMAINALHVPTDTITLRHDRTNAFDLSAVKWTVAAERVSMQSAPPPLSISVQSAVLKPSVAIGDGVVQRQGTGASFVAPASIGWNVGQIFVFDKSLFKVVGRFLNPDGSALLSTEAALLDEAFQSLKFDFKAHAVSYDATGNPVQAGQLPIQTPSIKRMAAASNVASDTSVVDQFGCVVPTATIEGDPDSWGYKLKIDCSLGDLLQKPILNHIRVAGSLPFSSKMEFYKDIEKGDEYSTLRSTVGLEDLSISLAPASYLDPAANEEFKKKCKVKNGEYSCEVKRSLIKGFTLIPLLPSPVVIPIEWEVGLVFKFTATGTGKLSMSAFSTYARTVGQRGGEKIDVVEKSNQPFFHLNRPEINGFAEAFGGGYGKVGISKSELKLSLVDTELSLGFFANANGTTGASANTYCFRTEAGLMAELVVTALRVGWWDGWELLDLIYKYPFTAFSKSWPNETCGAVGRINLDYSIVGADTYTANQVASANGVDVFDTSAKIFDPNTREIRFALRKTIGISGKSLVFELENLSADVVSSTRVIQPIDTLGQEIYPKAYAKVIGNQLSGKIAKLRLHAYVPGERVSTEVTRDIEIRIEPELSSNPAYWLQIGDDGVAWWKFESGFQSGTRERVAAGRLTADGGSTYVLQGEPGLLAESDRLPVTVLNGTDGKPVTLSLTSNVAMIGGSYSYPFSLRSDPIVTTLAVSPQPVRVGEHLAFVVEGERLPIQVPLVVPNCGPLIEQRAAGNVARNNFSTERREFRCTALSSGTNLVASVGSLKQAAFTILPVVVPPPVNSSFKIDETFDGSILNTSTWTGVSGILGYSVANSTVQFNRASYAHTNGKVTFDGGKIVIESRFGGLTNNGRDTNIALVDILTGDRIQAGDTNYQGQGFYVYATGAYGLGQQSTGSASTNAYLEYRITLEDKTLTLERGPSISNLTFKRVFTLGQSSIGRRYYLQIGTGGGIEYSPGTFDWIRVDDSPLAISSWCGQTLELTNNTNAAPPTGWAANLIRTGPGISGGQLRGSATNGGIMLDSSSITMPADVKSIVVEYDSSRTASGSGQFNNVEFRTNAGLRWRFDDVNWTGIGAGNRSFRSGLYSVPFFSNASGTTANFADQIVPLGLGLFKTRLTVRDGSVEWVETNLGTNISTTVSRALPSFTLASLVGAAITAYETDGGGTWVDNVKIQCLR